MVIVHGAAPGIDRAFAEACADHDIEQEPHPPRWRELRHLDSVLRLDRRKVAYNANAPAIRDVEMVAAGAAMCLAFHCDIRLAKETRDFALMAIEAGMPTYLIADDTATPRRIRIEDLL